MNPRLIFVGAVGGALAAASVPLVVAVIFALTPEIAFLAAAASALLGSYGGAELGAFAGK